MNINELNNYLQTLPEAIMNEAAEVVAETATEYFKDSFKKKAFDGNPWKPAKIHKGKGSLLIDSGALLNSIRPVVISPELVTISAGNEKVEYAQAHNEGFAGDAAVPAHVRQTRSGKVQVKAHTRRVNIPKREFMADSKELNGMIHKRLEGYVRSLLKQKNK